MNRFGNSDLRGRQSANAIGAIAAERSNAKTLLKRGVLLAAMLTLGGCSWFSNDEPAFPPTSGGPNIASVPNGLPGDSANAQYSDQELRALLGSAPRPLPPEPKAADTQAPDATAPEASPDGAPAAPAANAQPAATPPAGTVPAAPVPDAAKNNSSDYPDINTVPMQRPTPVPDAEQPSGEQKPKQSSMLMPEPHRPTQHSELLILTAAGSSPAAPTDLLSQKAPTQTAQTTAGSDDPMFSKPVLPPYTGYDQTQKQPQGVPAQSIYRSPYAGSTQLDQAGGEGGSLYYASQSDSGAQLTTTPGGRPVGLVYFGIGSTALGGADRQVLRQIADLQRAYGGVVRIVGHASSRTENMPMDQHRKTNSDVAAARAKAVAEQLVRYGVRPLFVQIAGVSDTQPLYPEFMPAGEAANRRAEIYLSSN